MDSGESRTPEDNLRCLEMQAEYNFVMLERMPTQVGSS